MPSIEKIIYGEHSLRVFLDNGESLKLPYSAVSEYSLSTGQDISGDIYIKIYDESLRFFCMEKALFYLSRRSRSAREMSVYLKKKGFRTEHIDSVIDTLSSRGYINDYDFAVSFIRNRISMKKYGVERIKKDLFLKGIDRNIIDKTLEECNAYSVDEDVLFNMAMKKYNSVKDKKNSYMKTRAFLQSRGFDYDSIRKVLAGVIKEMPDEQEE